MIGGLTKSEIAIILRGLNRQKQLTKANYEAVMAWATAAKLDSDILVLVFEGFIELGVDSEGVLQFEPTEAGMASSRRQELERMRV